MSLIHLGLDPSKESPQFAIVCGDPDRIDLIFSQFATGNIVTNKRGFRIAIGEIKNPKHHHQLPIVLKFIPVIAASHGIGGPSAAAVVEELIKCGIKIIIRVGTAGSYQPKTQQDDLLISQATIRHDGASRAYTGRLGPGFPAVADLDITIALRQAVRELNFRHQVGITRHIDGFYPDNFPDHTLFPEDLIIMKRALTQANVIGVSMESGTIFPLCTFRKIKAGEILAVTDKADEHQKEVVEGAGINFAIKTAIRAIQILYLQILKKEIEI